MATLYRVVFRSDVKNTSPIRTFYRNAIFRRIIATEKCCFAQLLKVVHSAFPYRIGAFSCRYAESYPVYIYGASVVKWLAHLPFTSKAADSSLSENSPNATRTQSSREKSKSQRSVESRGFSPGTPVSSHRESCCSHICCCGDPALVGKAK
jgi:hypothetical protein